MTICEHDPDCFFLKQAMQDHLTNEEIRRAGGYSLAIELSEMLERNGFWSPTITDKKDNYANIITAFGLAFTKLKEANND
jgi:hypothetical protein